MFHLPRRQQAQGQDLRFLLLFYLPQCLLEDFTNASWISGEKSIRPMNAVLQVYAVDVSNDMISTVWRSATMSRIIHCNCSSGHYFGTFQAAVLVITFCAQSHSPQLQALATTLWDNIIQRGYESVGWVRGGFLKERTVSQPCKACFNQIQYSSEIRSQWGKDYQATQTQNKNENRCDEIKLIF